MLESLGSNELVYQKLSPEEMTQRGILGRLVGVCASFIAPTRNGRKYSESLWEKTFNDPIMQEKINNRVCYGELGHPADREEIDMSKVAVCLAEIPKKGKDGKLRAVFDILSTPNGQILKQLCDYGSTLGISSRGSGDTYIDDDGEESVDEDTYNCECFDVVYLPAVKEARLKYVTESLKTKNNNKTLSEALNDTIINAKSDSERNIMRETLNSLDIKLDENYTANAGNLNIDKHNHADEVDNIKSDVIGELQESLKRQQYAESQVRRLQEKLSVCNAKDEERKLQIEKLKRTIATLTEKARKCDALEQKISTISESVSANSREVGSKNDRIKFLTERVEKEKKIGERKIAELSEQISSYQEQLKSKDAKIKRLSEQISKAKNLRDSNAERLSEQIADIKRDSEILCNNYKAKIEKSNELVEKYKATAQKAVNKYIKVQSNRYGINENEVMGRLPKDYSFADIDRICEDMRSYKMNLDNLPFSVNGTSRPKQVRVSVKESVESIIPNSGADDSVDDVLMSLAGLN